MRRAEPILVIRKIDAQEDGKRTSSNCIASAVNFCIFDADRCLACTMAFNADSKDCAECEPAPIVTFKALTAISVMAAVDHQQAGSLARVWRRLEASSPAAGTMGAGRNGSLRLLTWPVRRVPGRPASTARSPGPLATAGRSSIEAFTLLLTSLIFSVVNRGSLRA